MSGDAEVTAAVSGSRTTLTINGAEATREQLVVGMVCDMEYNPSAEDNEFVSVACVGEGAAAAPDAAPAMATATADITALADGGKAVNFMADGQEVTGSVSGSRTTLTIDGAAAERDALVVGMSCEMTYNPAAENEFKTLACSN